MVKIKKAFVELHEFLQENADKKVKTIMDDIEGFMSAKSGGGSASNYILDDNGNVLAVFCYYHKRWELPAVAEYGAKANTATGLNTMCKEGVSRWTKQKSAAKKEEAELLTRLQSGDITVDDIESEQEAIKARSEAIVAREDEHGFDSAEDAIAADIDKELADAEAILASKAEVEDEAAE
ncbi:MAG: hypothetical protein R3240_00070 [Gammaproteobacteria bacterium]|nr:hypothetical protein [Gammaproteobacteria bacterium]